MMGTTSVFGRDKSVSVTFKGDKAHSGRGKVNFPALDPNTNLDGDTVKLFRGWVDSESALARYSDKTFYNDKEPLRESQPLLYDLFKSIETARVEGEYTGFYVGAGKNLAELSDKTADLALKTYDKDKEEHFWPSAISLFSRGRMNGVYNYMSRQRMADVVDAEQINDWVDEISDLETTEESFTMAERIFEKMKDDNQEDEEEQEGAGSGTGQYDPMNMGDIIDSESQGCTPPRVSGGLDQPWIPYMPQHDGVLHWSDDDWDEDINHYIQTRDAMGAQLSVAKKKLQLLIQSTQKIAWDSHKEMGRLDSKRLVAAYQAEPDVFKVKQDDTDLDTAVSILIDMSGSMKGYRSEHAHEALVILSELLDQIGVPFEVTGFDESWNKEAIQSKEKAAWDRMRGDDREIYTRITPLRHHEFKRFSDRIFEARKYYHYIASCEKAGEANFDSECVERAGLSLLKRPESRKILFVLSDGHPCADFCHSHEEANLTKVVKNLSRQMEVVGIGIQSSAVQKFYPKNIVLHDSADLPLTMLNLLRDKLLPTKEIVEKEEEDFRAAQIAMAEEIEKNQAEAAA